MRRLTREQFITAAVLAAIGLGVFFVLRVGSNGQKNQEVTGNSETVDPPKVVVGRDTSVPIIRGPAILPAVSQNGQTLVAVDSIDESLVLVNLQDDSLTTPFVGQVSGSPVWIRPDPTGARVAAHWDETQGQPAKTLLFGTDREPITLPATMTDLVWRPDGSEIVYVYWERRGDRDTTYTLATARPDGSDWRIVTPNLPTGPADIALAPNGEIVALTTKRTAVDDIDNPNPVILIPLETGLIQPLSVTGEISAIRWSADSLRLAYLKFTEDQPVGRLVFFDTREVKESLTEVQSAPALFAWQTNDALLAINLAGEARDPLLNTQTLTRFERGEPAAQLGMIRPGVVGIAIGLDGSAIILDRRTALYQIALE